MASSITTPTIRREHGDLVQRVTHRPHRSRDIEIGIGGGDEVVAVGEEEARR
jgi:hypothetical protein